MLDLGLDVNILPRKNWKSLRKPKLFFPFIQFQMENKYCILPVGRLQDVEVDIVGIKTYVDFEVIDIIGDKYYYPTLLGIYWALENYLVIDIK